MSLVPTHTGSPDDDVAVGRMSPEMFADAFVTHSRTLWCIAAGVLMSRDQVEDVLQDGAMIALAKLDQFDPGTSFIAWMGRIVRFVALNHGRRRRRSRTADPEAIETFEARNDATSAAPADAWGRLIADQAAFDDQVVAALGGLEETRDCLLLRALLDMPYRDIARALDIPEGTAMSHVHRARGTMRARLSEREAPGSPGASGAMAAGGRAGG